MLNSRGNKKSINIFDNFITIDGSTKISTIPINQLFLVLHQLKKLD